MLINTHHIHVHVHYTRPHKFSEIHIYIHVHTQKHIYMYMLVNICMHTWTCSETHIHVHASKHTHTYMYMLINTHNIQNKFSKKFLKVDCIRDNVNGALNGRQPCKTWRFLFYEEGRLRVRSER